MRRVKTQSLLLRVGKQEEKKRARKGMRWGHWPASQQPLDQNYSGRQATSLYLSLPSLSEKAQISAGFQDERR